MVCSVDSKCRVALISGGKSGERDVSLSSGACVKKALESAGLSVVPLDPARKEDLETLVRENFDVAFLCLHGRYGEDGTMQGLLELLEIPYTGSGVWSSASAMDKVKTKRIYELAGIDTPPYAVLKKEEKIDIDLVVRRVGNHAVVKASSEGSTLGLYMAETRCGIEEAIGKAFGYGDTVLVESFVSGREFTVAVLGNKNAKALPVIEIIPRNEFYDFDAKYSPGGSRHICPALVSEDLTFELQRIAELAHDALECRGMSRTDFLVDGNNRVWALETNTLPGMTDTSLLPDAARAVGLSYQDLCVKLLSLALE
ncbi:MAG TPA: D-alanine--D-alanine ligase [Candidatus Rubneribacter avistercoris]|nr:D-alanine--D-alanine ligase [Candidatus Rubneribacter avistercoris]